MKTTIEIADVLLNAQARLHRPRNVIAVDTHVVVYAHREDSEWHAAAYRTLGPG